MHRFSVGSSRLLDSGKLFAAAILGAAAILSCESSLAPLPGNSHNLVVVATIPRTDSGSLDIIDPSAGTVIGHIGPMPRFAERGPTSPDGSTLYLLPSLDYPTTEIAAIDTRSFGIKWRIRLSTLDEQPVSDSLHLSIIGTMGITPDGTRLLLTATAGENTGLAIFSVDTRTVTGFIPFVPVEAMATIAPSAAMPNGAILITAVRPSGLGLYTGMLYVLDGATFAMQDSVALTQASEDGSAGLRGVLAAPDGRHAYIFASQTFRYDLASHQITDSAATNGGFSISADGSTLYQADAGGFDYPGSGKINVFDANLTPRPPIDLTQIAPSPGTNGAPVVSDNVVTSSDSRLLYVAAGTPTAGGYGPAEPSRLLVLDAKTHALVRSIPLSGDSPFVLLVR